MISLLVLCSIAYAAGSWRRSRRRRPARWRQQCFWAGIATLVVALVSPVDALGELLFAGHMIQHLLLTTVAAPLLVLGDVGTMFLWALPPRGRRIAGAALRARAVRSSWRVLAHPVFAWALHGAALLFWHVPAPYELAIRSDAVHALEHWSFLVTALLFWWSVAAPHARRRLGFGYAIVYLFTAATLCGMLGALIALSSVPWYSVHDRWAPAWGLTPLEDQQLAGLIMWVPATVGYLAAIVPIVVRGLSERGYGDGQTHRFVQETIV